jgi:hypothetical protein
VTKETMTRLGKYLARWQGSTPILWIVVKLVGPDIIGTIIANLIGGLMFYPVDRYIFNNKKGEAMPEPCHHCAARGDLTICKTYSCQIQDSWYAKQLQAQNQQLLDAVFTIKAENIELKNMNMVLHNYLEDLKGRVV